MGKTKRKPNDAREASASDVCFCFCLFSCLLSALVLCVFIRSPLSPPFPQQYLGFCHLFDFRSFILPDSSLPNLFMICLAVFLFFSSLSYVFVPLIITFYTASEEPHQNRVPHSLCPHLRLQLRLRLYLHPMAMAIRTLWGMHTFLDVDTLACGVPWNWRASLSLDQRRVDLRSPRS